MDKSLIPKGTIYCYGENGACPYHRYIETIKLYENNGENCEYRKTCDGICGTEPNNSCKILVYRCEYMDYTDKEQESLLWDSIKECGENE